MNNALPLTDAFAGRHIGPHPGERDEMLKVIGAKNVDELFVDVPKGALLKDLVPLPKTQGEIEVHHPDYVVIGAER